MQKLSSLSGLLKMNNKLFLVLLIHVYTRMCSGKRVHIWHPIRVSNLRSILESIELTLRQGSRSVPSLISNPQPPTSIWLYTIKEKINHHLVPTNPYVYGFTYHLFISINQILFFFLLFESRYIIDESEI